MNAFAHMAQQLTQHTDTASFARITQAQYQLWRRQYSFDGLLAVRLGQSFCKHFNITDYALLSDRSPDHADQYIIKHYVTQS